MNVKLTEVVSDIAGLTGMSINRRHPGRANATPSNWPNCGMGAATVASEEIALALEALNVPASEHLFELRQAREIVSVPSSADHRVRPSG